jgi:hypothetical protein
MTPVDLPFKSPGLLLNHGSQKFSAAQRRAHECFVLRSKAYDIEAVIHSGMSNAAKCNALYNHQQGSSRNLSESMCSRGSLDLA